MSILIDLPEDRVALLRGLSGYYGQSPEEYLAQAINERLRVDTEAISLELAPAQD